MPTYEVELSDGRVFEVDSDTPPTEADVMSFIGGAQPPSKGLSTGAMLAGGAGIAALGAMGLKAAKTPGGIIPKALAFGGQLNALRQQAMLSGLALPKSILGGVGATVANSLERRSLKPLAELLSMETVKDVGSAFKAGRNVGPAGAATQLPAGMDLPGRAMGAFDDAITNALVRSGVGKKEATAAMMQAPLPFEDRLGGKAARALIPFRRTPFNQFFEGFEAMEKHPVISAGYGAAGAAQGAAQSDEQYPLTAGVGVAASAKYGMPQMIGQVLGRHFAGGKGGGGIAGSALPVSEYGVESTITEPLRPFEEPALIRLLQRAGLLRGRQ